MRSITCDDCGMRVDLMPWHLGLDNRRMPVKEEESQKQLLGREFHFCSLLCLARWIDKLGPKGPTGPS